MNDRSPLLGEMIRHRRQQLGLSLRDVENQTGISRANLSRTEAGEAGARPETLGALSAVLRLPLADLYEAAGMPIPQRLPSIRPYLRRAYNVPDEAVDEIEKYLSRFGPFDPSEAPRGGEDELPE